MLDILQGPPSPEECGNTGRLVDKEDYVSYVDASPHMLDVIIKTDPGVLEARGLDKFLTTDREMLTRYVCLPTTTLMAIRHLTGERALTLGHFYELGIDAHINDRPSTTGGIEKGYPSFHRASLDTYLRYALEFAKVAGLDGGIVTGFQDVGFAREVIKGGGVVILSVDNLFIPHVMNTELDPATFKPSRHAEMVHGANLQGLLVTDVSDFRNGMRWFPQNVPVEQQLLDQHITCPRLNDSFTRALVLTPSSSSWDSMTRTLQQFGTVEEARYNPLLIPYFSRGVATALEDVRAKAAKGLSQWDMI